MGRKRKPETERPSFFKVLVKDYSTRLRLPPAFVQENRKFLPEALKLRTSGQTWGVKLEKQTYDEDNDKKYWCFTGGWNKFVNDLDLKFGEFLVFRFNVDDSSFDVSVFGTNCFEREVSAMDVDSDDDDEEVYEVKNEYCHNVPDVRKMRLRSCKQDQAGGSGTHPHFERRLTDSRKSRVCIPKAFAEASGLIGQRAVVLEYPPKQRYWSILLDQKQRSSFNLDLASGWSDFRKENRLLDGKTYSFEFDPSRNVIQVKEKK